MINFKGDSDYWGEQVYFFLDDASKPNEVTDDDFATYREEWPVVEGRVLRYPDINPSDPDVGIYPEIWVIEYQGLQFTLTREREDSPLVMSPEVTKFYT